MQPKKIEEVVSDLNLFVKWRKKGPQRLYVFIRNGLCLPWNAFQDFRKVVLQKTPKKEKEEGEEVGDIALKGVQKPEGEFKIPEKDKPHLETLKPKEEKIGEWNRVEERKVPQPKIPSIKEVLIRHVRDALSQRLLPR